MKTHLEKLRSINHPLLASVSKLQPFLNTSKSLILREDSNMIEARIFPVSLQKVGKKFPQEDTDS